MELPRMFAPGRARFGVRVLLALFCALALLLQSGLAERYDAPDGVPQTAQPLGLAGSERVDDGFFDGAVFVGDSVSMKLRNYVLQARGKSPRLLGSARFLTIGSFAARLALQKVGPNSLHPTVGGEKMTVEDALVALGAKKLYIMLGMNDIGVSGVDGAVADMMTLLGCIREKLPELEIYVQSATPRVQGASPSTRQLFEYDLALFEAVSALGDARTHFVDVACALRGEDGKLPRAYCSDPDDMGIHLTDAACRVWIDYLYTHTA